MINSALFSRSTVSLHQSNIVFDDFKPEVVETKKKVNKATLYHLYQSYIKFIFKSQLSTPLQKENACLQYGFEIGYHFAQQQSQGFVKSFVPKPNEKINKPFIAEMKLLYTKIWTTVFDSTAKLFALSDQAAYKLQDKELTFTKSISSSNQQHVKNYKNLIYKFAKGVIQGFLKKFQLQAIVNFHEVMNQNIYFEIKEMSRKQR